MSKKNFSFILVAGLFVSLFLFNINLSAIIVETNKLDDIFKYANKDSIVVFDIDSTLVEIESSLEYWINHRDEDLEKMGVKSGDASDLTLYTFFVISRVAKLLPINNSPKTVNELQKMDIHSIALTNRSIPVANRTVKLLRNINIDFSKNGLYNDNLELKITHNGIFSRGIIFAGKNDKGKMLALFFKTINYVPKKLIYVDDRIEYVKSVESQFDNSNFGGHKVEFIGIRYSFMDEKKKNFDPKVAEKGIHQFKIQLGLEPLDPNFKGDQSIKIFQKKVSGLHPDKSDKVSGQADKGCKDKSVEAGGSGNCGWATYIWDLITCPFRKIYGLFA